MSRRSGWLDRSKRPGVIRLVTLHRQQRGRGGIWILPILIAAGLVLAAVQPVGIEQMLEWGQRLSTSPWFLVATVAVITILFSIGLPGSIGLWLIAPFNPPLLSILLLTSASTVGAVGAWCLASRLGERWKPSGFSRRIVDLLKTHGHPGTQLALRVLPGFPHSVINFAGGVLRLPLPGFIGAAIVGLAIKWGVYATAVHEIVGSVETGQPLQPSTIAPLILLSLLLIIGGLVRHRIINRTSPDQHS